MKIVVVGGGIIGLGIAWRLARGGAAVTLLERNASPGQEASWAAAGMLAPLAEVVETPGAFYRFGLESLKRYPQFLQELTNDHADPPDLSPYGIVRLAFDQPAFSKLNSQIELAHESGLGAEILSPEQVWELEPCVTKSHLVIGALHSKDERHIDPRQLNQSLVRACTNLGVEIVTGCDVAGIERASELIVKTNIGDYTADKLVVASGAWTARLAQSLEIHLPIYPRKGQVIALKPPEGVSVTHTIYSHQTYCVPRDGRIIIGATQHDVGFERSVIQDATRRLIDGAATLIPGLADAKILDEWIGFRPACSDNMPIMGWSDVDPRIYFANGHQRNGILLAPISAYSSADELLTDKAVQILTDFRPQRFAEKAVDNVKRKKVVLVIAGSDPSGGAGIQADQRVIEALGCEAVCIATALTSQNSHGVSAVFPVPIETLRSQLETLLADIRPDAVKIGLLPSAEHVEFVAEIIAAYNLPNVVLDPVIAPSYGQPFLYERGVEALRQKLLPLVTLVTPNIPEAVELCDMRISSRQDMEAAGRMLVATMLAGAALIKGGHSEDKEPLDILVQRTPEQSNQPRQKLDLNQRFLVMSGTGKWIETQHTHGTGCYLSSAIASKLATGSSLPIAKIIAKRALTRSLRNPRIVGSGHGSPGKPDIGKLPFNEYHVERLSRLNGIYYITDDRQSDTELLNTANAALRGGVRVIQLRHKTASTETMIQLAKELRQLTASYDALFILNDRVDIALASKADGVHLGPGDMSPIDARKVLGPELLIGISGGNREEINAYKSTPGDVSYVGCGPMFPTETKLDAGALVDREKLRFFIGWLGGHPVAAIGGITKERLADIHLSGINCAAVVSAISRASNPEQAARELVVEWDATAPPRKNTSARGKAWLESYEARQVVRFAALRNNRDDFDLDHGVEG